MLQSVLERAGEHVADSARKLHEQRQPLLMHLKMALEWRSVSQKHGCDAAEEFLDDTTKRLQRHPTEAVVVSLAVGVAVGIVIGFAMKRR